MVALPMIFLSGVLFWGAFNWSLELTNTETFCTSCHAMRTFLYAEYEKSSHFSNRTGVRATCPDCHVPREWRHKVIRKVAATNELFHWVIGSIDTREKFEAKRQELAANVWAAMAETDSRECRNCHAIDHMEQQAQSVKGSLMHALGRDWGKTCIDCHKGIAHSLPRSFDPNELMDELHDRMEREGLECETCHQKIAGAKKDDGW